MASLPPSRELELVLQRFFDLTSQEQLSTYRAIRDYLAERVRETKRDRVVAEREAALRALAEVATHLSLPVGKAPTPAQFDEAARSLGLGWDRSRVRRAWDRWRFAKAAYLGQRLRESSKQRDHRRKRGGPRHTREGHLTGVRLWLATDPADLTERAYRDWAHEYNDDLAPDALPVVEGPPVIGRALAATWPDVIRLARGEITRAEARPIRKARHERFCRAPHQLITFEDVQATLRLSETPTRTETMRPDFPAPVIVLPGRRFWLREDVAAYKAGRRWSPAEYDQQLNSLRLLYLTVEDVKALTGLSRAQITELRKGVPRPVASLGHRLLWLRSEVEASPAVRERGSLPR